MRLSLLNPKRRIDQWESNFGLTRQHHHQAKSSLQLALDLELTKLFSRRLRQNFSTLEQGHRQFWQALFGIGGVENLTYQDHSLGIHLGLDSNVDSIGCPAIKHLA